MIHSFIGCVPTILVTNNLSGFPESDRVHTALSQIPLDSEPRPISGRMSRTSEKEKGRMRNPTYLPERCVANSPESILELEPVRWMSRSKTVNRGPSLRYLRRTCPIRRTASATRRLCLLTASIPRPRVRRTRTGTPLCPGPSGRTSSGRTVP